jgi:lipopolysaccharide export system permease protein
LSVLVRYISRRFGLLLIMTATVLTALSLAFELLEETDNIIKASDGRAAAVLWYALLRVPDVTSKMLPIAALLAALATVGLMMRHNEMVALWSGGVSSAGVMRLFLPVAALMCVVQFALDDRVVPSTLTRLYDWGVGDFRRSGMLSGGTKEVWLLSGNDVIRLPAHNARRARLEDLTIFRRDAAGVLVEQLHAAAAVPGQGGWMLHDVSRYSVAPARGERLAELFWPGRIDLEHLSLISAGLRELSLNQLLTLIANQGFGQRPTALALTWAHARVANSLGPLLVAALVIACSQVYRRRGGFGIVMLSSLAIGFTYFILDNIGLALGESGFLSPWLAAWSSKVVLICTIGSLMLRHET